MVGPHHIRYIVRNILSVILAFEMIEKLEQDSSAVNSFMKGRLPLNIAIGDLLAEEILEVFFSLLIFRDLFLWQFRSLLSFRGVVLFLTLLKMQRRNLFARDVLCCYFGEQIS